MNIQPWKNLCTHNGYDKEMLCYKLHHKYCLILDLGFKGIIALLIL
jgi:hypothetical protein